MSPERFLTFTAAALLLVLSPGPVNVVAMANAVAHGRAAALRTVLGASLSIALQLLVTLCGISALAALEPRLLAAARLAGAACLLVLGVRQWRAPVDKAGVHGPARARAFRSGFLVSSANPKSLVFFPAFFPQFVEPAAAPAPQLALLGLTFLVIFAGGVTAWALLAAWLQAWLATPARRRACNRVLGGALVATALWLGLDGTA